MTWHSWVSLLVDLFWIGLALALLFVGGSVLSEMIRMWWRRRQIDKELKAIDLQHIAKMRDFHGGRR